MAGSQGISGLKGQVTSRRGVEVRADAGAFIRKETDMPVISSATRRIPKATYVALTVGQAPAAQSAAQGSSPAAEGALVKFGFVRRLSLQSGEVDQALATLANQPATSLQSNASALANTLRAFEGAPLPAALPAPGVLATIPTADLSAFGHALITARRQAVTAAGATTPDALQRSALVTHQLNAAIVATKGFETNATASRIGMLNLERLEMTPAGLERGELIATIPLAPMEQTSVVQKEWSVTSQEFTSIVTDSLENYSETGVTENTELAQSTTSQATHNNQFNATGTVQGSFASFVSASASSGFTSQDQSSKSATDSRKDAVALTRKASSRVKQSHKVTISTTTTSGASETSTRTLQNPSATDPMRIDYFSLMRKWHVGLYRYGLRLTYDVVIPEPGAAMRKLYAQLAELQAKVSPAFIFPVPISAVTELTYKNLADQWGAVVPEPPDASLQITAGGPVPNIQGGDGDGNWNFFTVPLEIKDGYMISHVQMDAMLSGIGNERNLKVFNAPDWETFAVGTGAQGADLTARYGFMTGFTGEQSITVYFNNCAKASITFVVALTRTDAALRAWAGQVWQALYNAAQATYYTEQQALVARIQALQDQINNVDTLTLRREENDEIMKRVVQWILGEGFNFMPADVVALFSGNPDPYNGIDPGKYGVAFTGPSTNLSTEQWTTLRQHEDLIRFVNDAIEWENIVYFLYSYFWDVPTSWEFIRSIRHPDATRQGFLRSGSARIVLTVRQGFEEAWVRFAEGGFKGADYSGPYLTIAQQIADYNDANYPGIPPTRPGGAPLPDDEQQVASTSSDSLSAGTAPVTISVASSDGFVPGYTAILDSYDSGKQEAQTITAVPDATHIVVQALSNPHDGSQVPFAVMQAGEKGVLIAEWFEYTPSSGTDIAVTSNLATIA